MRTGREIKALWLSGSRKAPRQVRVLHFDRSEQPIGRQLSPHYWAVWSALRGRCSSIHSLARVNSRRDQYDFRWPNSTIPRTDAAQCESPPGRISLRTNAGFAIASVHVREKSTPSPRSASSLLFKKFSCAYLESAQSSCSSSVKSRLK